MGFEGSKTEHTTEVSIINCNDRGTTTFLGRVEPRTRRKTIIIELAALPKDLDSPACLSSCSINIVAFDGFCLLYARSESLPPVQTDRDVENELQ